jgi:CheY-like chemotaxis protein
MKKTILVIDDEELLTRTFARLLEKKGYEVLVATHSEDALAMAEEEDFDLILCDIRMPGRNGVETIREIRRLRRESGRIQPPVIFLTGFADEKLEREAQALDPVAYVFKPFDTAKLLEAVESTVQAE